jgi:hypothetical protein
MPGRGRSTVAALGVAFQRCSRGTRVRTRDMPDPSRCADWRAEGRGEALRPGCTGAQLSELRAAAEAARAAGGAAEDSGASGLALAARLRESEALRHTLELQVGVGGPGHRQGHGRMLHAVQPCTGTWGGRAPFAGCRVQGAQLRGVRGGGVRLRRWWTSRRR